MDHDINAAIWLPGIRLEERHREPLPSPASLLPGYPELEHLPDDASRTAAALIELPVRRNLELRKDRVLKGIHKGKGNCEAALGQVRGFLPPSGPCIRCSKIARRPKGPFATCIVVPGQFDGACCNCRYNGDGSGCNFHRMSICSFLV